MNTPCIIILNALFRLVKRKQEENSQALLGVATH